MTKNKILTALLISFLATSCKETSKQENKTPDSTSSILIAENENKVEKWTDKKGNILETISFSETDNTLKLKLNSDTLVLKGVPSGSGSHFKNDHFEYIQWHGKTIIEKDGKVIFEAGEETMPK